MEVQETIENILTLEDMSEKMALMEQYAHGILEVWEQQKDDIETLKSEISKLKSRPIPIDPSGRAMITLHLLAEVWEVLHNAQSDAENLKDGVLKDADFEKALRNVELLAKIENGALRTNFFD